MSNVFATAAKVEHHPEVARVIELNAWKIKTWREYASWKRHARQWVALGWHLEQNRMWAAREGFTEVEGV